MYKKYLVLGDSMSIDEYPQLDAQRHGKACRPDIGAASLLFDNENELFPEFCGKDLKSYYPHLTLSQRATDGAICDDVFATVSKLRIKERCIVTLTLGGNDLLAGLRRRSDWTLSEYLQRVMRQYENVLQLIRRFVPDSLLVLSTVFDPTDGTGILPVASSMYDGPLPIRYLDEFNKFIVQSAESNGALLADIHGHFVGHGANCSSASDFWYWPTHPIEPSYVGASEIRRVWWQLLQPQLQKSA